MSSGSGGMASDPNIIGSKIVVDDKPRTVIGVMPRGFQFFVKQQSFYQKAPEMWVPMILSAERATSHGRYLQADRIAASRSHAAASPERHDEPRQQLEAEDPASMKNWGVNLVPLRTQLVGEIEPGLRYLQAAVGLVLLIACANVATLFLARAAARKHEIAHSHGSRCRRHPRSAANPHRELPDRDCLGGAAGWLLAWWSTRVLLAYAPANLIPLEGVSMDMRVLAFTSAVALMTGVLFGTVPAVQAARTSPREPLNEGGRDGSSGLQRSRARNAFVVTEFALALILLTGAGLLVRSLYPAHGSRSGLRTEKCPVWKCAAAQCQVRQRTNSRAEFYAQLLSRLRQLPGVRSASADAFLPFAGIIAGTGVDVEGRPSLPMAEKPVVDITLVEPQFFETMGIPAVAGQDVQRTRRCRAVA